MSEREKPKSDFKGAPERAHNAGDGAPLGSDTSRQQRFTASRKVAAATRVLRGEPLETVARDLNITVAKLAEWRDRALAGALSAMKERDRDERDEEIARLKAKVGEITMDNELLYEKIAAMESKSPLARRRSRR
jgi:hypothetical protein